MAKFLQFIDDADDAATYPVEKLISMTCGSDSALILKFSPGSLGTGQAASLDIVTLAITANSEKSVMSKIADSISFSEENVLVVADDVVGAYLDVDITACAITLDA